MFRSFLYLAGGGIAGQSIGKVGKMYEFKFGV
jgi:hypothetical protein